MESAILGMIGLGGLYAISNQDKKSCNKKENFSNQNKLSSSNYPINTINFAKENNLFAEKAYPQQSKEAINMHQMYLKRGQHINNLLHCGRHAQFRYWGMPETVNSAYEMSKLLD